MREDRRRRYDDGFRREALELIKSGAGKDTLARRLAIPVYTARNWIRLYRSNGEEAVMGGGGSRRYDWETKVAAARDHVENGLTKTEAMARHGIASIASLERWCRECVLSSAGVPFYRGWLSGLPVNCLPGYRRLVSSGFGCFVIA